jgi:hypothetical protein
MSTRRNITISLIALTLIVSGISVCILSAGEQSKEKEINADLQQAKTLEEFEKAAFSIQEKRSELITYLIRMLRSETNTEKKIRICYLLGEYRATEAIIDLAKNITLEAQIANEETKIPKWGKYPAQEALIKCGYSSIRYMISNIASSDDKQVRELSTSVIWQIIGEGLSRVADGKEYAQMIIEKSINKETDKVKKERLTLALVYLKPVTVPSSQANSSNL